MEEYGRLRRGKWHLKNVAASIDSLSNSVGETLDEDKLKLSAMEGLKAKALERMRFEGVSDRQQQIVIAEMNKVLEEQIKPTSTNEGNQHPVEGTVEASLEV